MKGKHKIVNGVIKYVLDGDPPKVEPTDQERAKRLHIRLKALRRQAARPGAASVTADTWAQSRKKAIDDCIKILKEEFDL